MRLTLSGLLRFVNPVRFWEESEKPDWLLADFSKP